MKQDPEFQPSIVGFVVGTGFGDISQLKLEIVHSIQKLDGDERAYLHRPSNYTIPRWAGQAVGDVSNHHFRDEFHLGDGVKDVVKLFAEVDEDMLKYIFVFTDAYGENSFDAHKLKKALRHDQKDGLLKECSIRLYGVGDKYDRALADQCELHPDCEYRHFDSCEGIAEAIITTYRKTYSPFFLTNYEPLNTEEMRKDYKELLDGEDQSSESMEGERFEDTELFQITR